MDPIQNLEQASMRLPHTDPGLNVPLATELGLVDLLHSMHADLGERHMPPAVERLVLSATNDGQFSRRGNPVAWQGWSALTVAVVNPNNFRVFVGHGGGSGVAGSGSVPVPPRSIAVLPIASELYMFGCDAGRITNQDFSIFVARYATVLAPALSRLSSWGSSPLGFNQYAIGAAAAALSSWGKWPSDAGNVLLFNETVDLRWRDDGTAPTAAVGQLLKAGSQLDYDGDLTGFQMISTGANTTVDASFYA